MMKFLDLMRYYHVPENKIEIIYPFIAKEQST